MSLGFTDPASPLACDLDDVVAPIRRLLAAAREAGLPIVYTTVAYDEGDRRTAAVFIDKVPALLTLEAGSRFVEIDPRLAPAPGDPVLTKLFASAFHGTPLATLLASERLRRRDRHRRLDLGLRPRDGGRRAAARLPHDRPARGRRRPEPGGARGEPLRHRRQVRRRASRSTRSLEHLEAAVLAGARRDDRPRPRQRLAGRPPDRPRRSLGRLRASLGRAGAAPRLARGRRRAPRRRLGGLGAARRGRRRGQAGELPRRRRHLASRLLPGLHRRGERAGRLRRPARLDARRRHLPAALRARPGARAHPGAPRCRISSTRSSTSRRPASTHGSRRPAPPTTSAGATTSCFSSTTASRSTSACATSRRSEAEPVELQGYTLELVAPWRVTMSPFPFVESPARFALVRRVIPKGSRRICSPSPAGARRDHVRVEQLTS